jgi:hypothetical protein
MISWVEERDRRRPPLFFAAWRTRGDASYDRAMQRRRRGGPPFAPNFPAPRLKRLQSRWGDGQIADGGRAGDDAVMLWCIKGTKGRSHTHTIVTRSPGRSSPATRLAYTQEMRSTSVGCRDGTNLRAWNDQRQCPPFLSSSDLLGRMQSE